MTQKAWTRKDVSRVTGLTGREIKYLREAYEQVTGKKNRDGYDKHGNPYYKSGSYRFPGTLLLPESDRPVYTYSDEDITRMKQIAVYKELGIQDTEIAKMIDDENYDWSEALDKQILEMRKKREKIENQLLAAEYLRHMTRFASTKIPEISMIDKSADEFVAAMKEELITPENLEFLISTTINNKNENVGLELETLYNEYSQLPASEITEILSDKEAIKNIIKMVLAILFPNNNPEDVLFLYRILCDLGGFSLILDALFVSIGGKDIISEALEEYYQISPRQEKKKHNHTAESVKLFCQQEIIKHKQRILNNKKNIEKLTLDIQDSEEEIKKYEFACEHFDNTEFQNMADKLNNKEE